MTENDNNDYNSKVNKLLNSFNVDDDNLTFNDFISRGNTLNTNITQRRENEKIQFGKTGRIHQNVF